ncbi:MAG: metallophosphoesterase, partial [Limosilactobacillus sp.]|nr:metallophosphoesterase [Limosilactobacillus sp.]
MRFLHTADWHVGKELNGYDLTADHQVAFEQIKSLAQTEHVDAIVVAGDLYDRRVPREAAVETV